jgi:predicted HAD superfamily Cof-like phosphohydrolase
MATTTIPVTNFEKVKQFMKIAGQTETTSDLSNDKLIEFRLSLIEEELNELKEALKNKDMVEVRDAISDIEYVILGAAVAFDINADTDFDIVHKSNMTKFCSSEEEAQNTVNWYKENKKDLYDSPYYEKVDDVWVVKNRSTGKVLKSINYQPVKFN